MTQIAYPLKVNGLSKNCEFIGNACRQLNIFEGFMLKIYDPFALNTLKMLVFVHAAVKAPGISRPFNYRSGTYPAKSQQRSVNGIERYARKRFSYLFIQNLCRRVLISANQLLVYFYTLWSYPQPGFFTDIGESAYLFIHTDTAYFSFYFIHNRYYIVIITISYLCSKKFYN
jgi:hypothetical protein